MYTAKSNADRNRRLKWNVLEYVFAGNTIFSQNDFNTIIMSYASSGDSDQSGEFSLQILWITIAKGHNFLLEESVHPYQTGRMPNLIRVVDVRMF